MTPADDPPFDPGLQPERTLLAWQRTSLAIGVAGVVMVRLTAHHIGMVSLIFAGAGLVGALAASALASRRYRRVHLRLTRDGQLPTGGGSVALLAAASALIAASALAYVVAAAFSR